MEAPHWTAGQHLSPRAETTLITPVDAEGLPAQTFALFLSHIASSSPHQRFPAPTTHGNECTESTTRRHLKSNWRAEICHSSPEPSSSKAMRRRSDEVEDEAPNALAVRYGSRNLFLSSPILTLTPSEPVSRSLPQGSRSHSIVHLELLCASGGGLGRAEECCFVNSTRRTVKWCSLGEQGFDVGQRGC
ncbi:hypothetical protein FA13DRAFT_1176003 [Coprinellus micaceus]|uniref:Uncharacterized protein n=1 Tax=Coprinellus micaceus TaxID=71717 RepID=A0A4Y7STR2_COPMI|nr:hypothetical protein FA13DRAFT_1176003 [Coprinellus micaceus]